MKLVIFYHKSNLLYSEIVKCILNNKIMVRLRGDEKLKC